MPPLTGFIGPTYQAQHSVIDAEELVNWFVEKRETGTPRASMWYLAMPGLYPRQTVGVGPYRGSFSQDGRQWVISGTGFYEVFADKSSTLRGTVAAGLDQGSIVSNGKGGFQLFICVGYYGYVYSLTANTLTQIVDADFPQGRASKCEFLDGYGIVMLKDSASFQISGLEDFTAWDPLDIAQKSQTSDDLVSILTDWDHKILYLFGSLTIERWWDSGAAAFPFEPVPNSIASQGCASGTGVASPGNAVVWVSQNQDGGRMAMADAGGSVRRISTHGVEAQWATYPTMGDAILLTFDWQGHSFVIFQFPTADVTWGFDVTSGEWFKWMEWNDSTGRFEQSYALTHFTAFETHLCGSRVDGTLFELRTDTFTDNTKAIRRLRRSPHYGKQGAWVFCDKLQFNFQVGVGLTSGQGSDPRIMLRISRDGGVTWGGERWASLGKIGEYLTRVLFWRNGRWRDGVVELTVTDPVVTALTDVWADVEAEAVA